MTTFDTLFYQILTGHSTACPRKVGLQNTDKYGAMLKCILNKMLLVTYLIESTPLNKLAVADAVWSRMPV